MIIVRVPATSANIGPGFDCLGLALNLYNTFYFEETEDGLIIEGCEPSLSNENNLIYISMKKCFKRLGYEIKGIKIKVEHNIPISRGLGSSASCIVAGIIGASEIAKAGLSKEEILEIATEIEGHPDNVAPALFGGITVALQEGNQVYYSKVNIAKPLKFYALVPDFKLSTQQSREVLPKQINFKDGVFNVSRVALLISALNNGELELLKTACADKLHESYRGVLIEGFQSIKEKCKELNCKGVFLSGAGPTVIVLTEDSNEKFYIEISKFLKELDSNWEVKTLNIDFTGAKILKDDTCN